MQNLKGKISAEPDENAHVALYFFSMHFTQVCRIEKVYHTLLNQGISNFKNSVDPDQLASEKPANRDLHCIPCSNRIHCNKHTTELIQNINWMWLF